MADAKLGTLAARVSVDRGNQAHYGVDDIITGKIILTYLPYKSLFKKNTVTADYFGPLKLEATLRGKVAIKVKRSRDTVISSDYGTRLFMQHFEVFNGSFKAEIGQNYEFPFSALFPASIGGYPIPPSFSIYFSDYPDRVDAAVRYRLGAKVTTPGIKVETSSPDYNPEPQVRFDLPRPPQAIFGMSGNILEQRAYVQSKKLLPEAERPSGMKQSLKAAFSSSSFPRFVANITCTSIVHACPGLRPRFSLAVRRVDGETTAPFFPDVDLISFGVNLIAHTTVDTSERLMASGICFESHTAQKLMPSRNAISFPVILSKANDYSVDVEMDPFGMHPSSFAHPKIARKYLLEIKARLSIADSSVSFNKQFPIEMLPPPAHIDLGMSGEAGPSTMNENAMLDEEHAVPEYTPAPESSKPRIESETDAPPPAYDAAKSGGKETNEPGGSQREPGPG